MLCVLCFRVFSLEHYYCIAADDRFYSLLENLIGSIHHYDNNIGEIAVYDLGLTKLQIQKLRRFRCVTINELELTNSQLLTPIVTCPSGRKVRGCFSWKHVVLKQALEKFPYVLYLDAGVALLDNPADIFCCIEEQGYFFLKLRIEEHHYIENRITQTVVEKVINQDFKEYKEMLLQEDTAMQVAGVQGVSRKIYDAYVLPLYEYSKNFELYYDDGSAKLGYGQARHDQTLSSILVHVNGFNMFSLGEISLKLKDRCATVYCNDVLSKESMQIFISQAGSLYKGGFKKYIQYKRGR